MCTGGFQYSKRVKEERCKEGGSRGLNKGRKKEDPVDKNEASKWKL